MGALVQNQKSMTPGGVMIPPASLIKTLSTNNELLPMTKSLSKSSNNNSKSDPAIVEISTVTVNGVAHIEEDAHPT